MNHSREPTNSSDRDKKYAAAVFIEAKRVGLKRKHMAEWCSNETGCWATGDNKQPQKLKITVQRLINRFKCALCKQIPNEIDLKWSFLVMQNATVAITNDFDCCLFQCNVRTKFECSFAVFFGVTFSSLMDNFTIESHIFAIDIKCNIRFSLDDIAILGQFPGFAYISIEWIIIAFCWLTRFNVTIYRSTPQLSDFA